MARFFDVILRTCRAGVLAGAAGFIACGPAAADQYDERLDELFEELRAGPAADAPGRIERIRRIWSDAPSDSVDLLYARAMTSAEAGDAAVAGALLDHALALGPHFAEAYVLRGVVRRQVGDAEGAEDDLRRAVSLEPRHFMAYRMLAEISLARGDKRAAYDFLQSALRANPHDDAAAAEARRLAREVDGQET